MSAGKSTATEIAKETSLSVQDVLLHLNNLELIRLIERDGLLPISIRGRNPKRYKISRLAIVLIPSEIVDKNALRQFISKKSFELMKKRILTCIVLTIAWATILSAGILGTHAFSKFRIEGFPQSAFVDNVLLVLVLCLSSAAILGITWKLAYRARKSKIHEIVSAKSTKEEPHQD